MRICSCGKTLDDNTYACPSCGRRFTPLSTWLLGIGLPLAVVLVAYFSCR